MKRYKIPDQVLIDLARSLDYYVISMQHGKVNLTDTKTGKTFHWNPLVSNDDALVLAERFDLIIQFGCVDGEGDVYVAVSYWPEGCSSEHEIAEFGYYTDHDSPLEAVRYTITRLIANLNNINWIIENAD